MPKRMWTIRYERRFEQQIAQFIPDPVVRDDALAGLEVALANAPASFEYLPEQNVWVAGDNIIPIGRNLLVIYTFDESYVTLLSVIEA
jgi:hypothetical protein